jgi:hypothetical protein
MLLRFAPARRVEADWLTMPALWPRCSRHQSTPRRSPFKANALALALLATIVAQAMAETPSPKPIVEFNIPSQSLRSALIQYGDVTGRDAVYDTDAAAGVVSGSVQGGFAPDDALTKLLSGTGLAAQFVTERTFALLPSPAKRVALQQTRSPEHQRYYGLIQAGLVDAFCRSGPVRPDRYRFVAAMWIASDGTVRRSQRIGATGTLENDAQIDITLRGVRIGEAPPAGFLQPVLILIVPNGPGVTRACGDAGPDLRKLGLAP